MRSDVRDQNNEICQLAKLGRVQQAGELRYLIAAGHFLTLKSAGMGTRLYRPFCRNAMKFGHVLKQHKAAVISTSRIYANAKIQHVKRPFFLGIPEKFQILPGHVYSWEEKRVRCTILVDACLRYSSPFALRGPERASIMRAGSRLPNANARPFAPKEATSPYKTRTDGHKSRPRDDKASGGPAAT